MNISTPAITPNRWVWALAGLTGALMVTAGFARYTFPLVAPELEDGSYSATGFFVGLGFASYLVVTVGLATWWNGHHPSRLVVLGVATAIVGFVVVAVDHSNIGLMVGTVLMGISAAGGFIPASAIVAAIVPAPRRGLASGVLLSGIGLSVVITGRVVAFMSTTAGDALWQRVWLITIAMSVAVLVLCIVVMPSIPPVVERRSSPLAALRQVPSAGILLTTYVILGATVTVCIAYLVPVLRDEAGLGQSHTSYVSSLLGAAMIGGLLVGQLSDRFGRRRMMTVSFLGMSVAMVCLPLGREPLLSLTVLAIGILTTGTGAMYTAYLADHLPPQRVGAAMGALTVVTAAGQVLGPPLGGWVAERSSTFWSTYTALGLLALVAAVLSCRLDISHPARNYSDGYKDRVPVSEGGV